MQSSIAVDEQIQLLQWAEEQKEAATSTEDKKDAQDVNRGGWHG